MWGRKQELPHRTYRLHRRFSLYRPQHLTHCLNRSAHPQRQQTTMPSLSPAWHMRRPLPRQVAWSTRLFSPLAPRGLCESLHTDRLPPWILMFGSMAPRHMAAGCVLAIGSYAAPSARTALPRPDAKAMGQHPREHSRFAAFCIEATGANDHQRLSLPSRLVLEMAGAMRALTRPITSRSDCPTLQVLKNLPGATDSMM